MPDPTDKPRLSITGRPFDARTDVLLGPIGEQHRHLYARAALMEALWARLDDHWTRWCTTGPIAEPSRTAADALDALARGRGLQRRGELQPEVEERKAIIDSWCEAITPLLPATAYFAAVVQATYLAQKLGLRFEWLLLELQSLYFWALISFVTGKGLHLGLGVIEPGTSVNVRLEPGESAAAFLERARQEHQRATTTPTSRLPKGYDYIKLYVDWLMRHHLDKVSIRKLAMEYAAQRPDGVQDARKHVSEGIALAIRWLNAVEVPPAVAPLEVQAHEAAQELHHHLTHPAVLPARVSHPRSAQRKGKRRTARAQRKRNRRR